MSTSSAPYLDLLLSPSRSLSPRGFLALMLVASGFSALVGGYFYLQGAWPILGFFGLDLALLYWAFKVSYKRAERVERVALDDQSLRIERTWPGRSLQSWTFQPAWVQVGVEHPDEHHAKLYVRERGQRLALGTFLPPQERSEVAEAIIEGLDRRKRALLPSA